MKESYVEGLASHDGLESCVYVRKGVGEALAEVCMGQVLSCEIHSPRRKARADRGAEALDACRKPHRDCRIGKAIPDPAQSETLSTCGNTLHGNREIPRPATSRWEASDVVRIVKPEGVRR
jgi:hypothetical protein